MTQSPAPVTAANATVSIRGFRAGDLAALLAMNAGAVPAVNDLSAEELTDQIAEARACIVAVKDEMPVGFLLCYDETADYDSRNFKWLQGNVARFFYTDRICVAPELRGHRIGEALYQGLFDRFAAEGQPFVCEVNTRPANPGSVRFHQRLGFREIGTADYGDKAVVYLQR